MHVRKVLYQLSYILSLEVWVSVTDMRLLEYSVPTSVTEDAQV